MTETVEKVADELVSQWSNHPTYQDRYMLLIDAITAALRAERAAERERCAKVAEDSKKELERARDVHYRSSSLDSVDRLDARWRQADQIAAAIRTQED